MVFAMKSDSLRPHPWTTSNRTAYSRAFRSHNVHLWYVMGRYTTLKHRQANAQRWYFSFGLPSILSVFICGTKGWDAPNLTEQFFFNFIRFPWRFGKKLQCISLLDHRYCFVSRVHQIVFKITVATLQTGKSCPKKWD